MAQINSIKEYFSPSSLLEASHLITSFPESAKILAGGTDLLILLSQIKEKEIKIVSLKNINELREIHKNKEGQIFIGAMAKLAEVAQSPLVNRFFSALARASELVGSLSVRNLGTIGGNICNASPSAETAPPLLIYKAKAVIWSPTGEKELDIEEFFTGPSTTILKPGEILKGFTLLPEKGLLAAYEKLGTRKAMEIAIVNVGIAMQLEKNKTCREMRIALGAVAPTPIRARKAENILKNKKLTREVIKEAAQMAVRESKPISDIRASADYRKKMIAYLVEKLILDLSNLRKA